MKDFRQQREFLKDSLRKIIDFRESDQHRGVPAPALEEPAGEDLPRLDLPGRAAFALALKERDIELALANRQSRRNFNGDRLSLEELAFLLWATQGVRKPQLQAPHFRTVPSAGARHSFETFLFVQRVEGVPAGLYRYLPLSHQLVLLREWQADWRQLLSRAVFGQHFVGNGAVVLVWTTVPYRMEWRYLEAAHRVILLDAGHVCQNLYLACEAIKAGTCAIAAYDQEAIDELLGVDGTNQFAIYLAPVGKCGAG